MFSWGFLWCPDWCSVQFTCSAILIFGIFPRLSFSGQEKVCLRAEIVEHGSWTGKDKAKVRECAALADRLMLVASASSSFPPLLTCRKLHWRRVVTAARCRWNVTETSRRDCMDFPYFYTKRRNRVRMKFMEICFWEMPFPAASFWNTNKTRANIWSLQEV